MKNEGKGPTTKYVELTKAIRKHIKENISKHWENQIIEELIQKNCNLRDMRPNKKQPKIIALADGQGTEGILPKTAQYKK